MRARWLYWLIMASGCTTNHQLTPVEPSWRFEPERFINYWTHRDRRPDVSRAKDGVIVVGTELTVFGEFSATCEERDRSKWFGDHPEVPYEQYKCKEEDTDVRVTCHGPCVVGGRRIKATGLGRLAVAVELTAQGKRVVEHAVLTAVAPEGFTIGPCLGPPDAPWLPRSRALGPDDPWGDRVVVVADGATCVARYGRIEVRIHAVGHEFRSEGITVTSSGNTIPAKFGEFDLVALLRRPPPWLGPIDVELQFGELRKPFQLFINPAAKQPEANPSPPPGACVYRRGKCLRSPP